MASEIEPDNKLNRHQSGTPFLPDINYVFLADFIRIEDGNMQFYNSYHSYEYYDIEEGIYKKNYLYPFACLPYDTMDRAESRNYTIFSHF
jgi:hypothetical protein